MRIPGEGERPSRVKLNSVRADSGHRAGHKWNAYIVSGSRTLFVFHGQAFQWPHNLDLA